MSESSMPVNGNQNLPENLPVRMRSAMEARGLSQTAAAARIGHMSAATLSQWLNGKYEGDNDAVDRKVRRFLDGLGTADQLIRIEAPGFQHTVTAQRMWSMMTQAQHGPAMMVVAGVPGVGKTVTAKAYAAASPNVWLVTMDPTVVSPSQVLQEIARTMGMALGSPVTLRERLGERLGGSGGLLIVDEAQHLSTKALDMLRSLYDRYETGIVFLGNFGLYAGTSAPSRTHNFAQFFRRIRRRMRIDEPGPRDIEIMLDAWSIEGAEERKFLATVAGKMWGLGGLENTIHEASTIALGAGEPLSIGHLRSAWAGLNHFDG